MSEYITKHPSWNYEKEVRLQLKGPEPWLNGKIELSPHDRLFHYDPRQLVGVICGARISKPNKKRIFQIIRDVRSRFCTFDDHRDFATNFVFFQAKLIAGQRRVSIIPENILTTSKELDACSTEGRIHYRDWYHGNAWRRNGTQSYHEKIK